MASVRGRPERPIDPADGPLAAFACALRALRERAGGAKPLSYRALADRSGLSITVLSQAAGGRQRPTWNTTKAYVEACGGDLEQWRQVWLAAGRPGTSDTNKVAGEDVEVGNANAGEDPPGLSQSAKDPIEPSGGDREGDASQSGRGIHRDNPVQPAGAVPQPTMVAVGHTVAGTSADSHLAAGVARTTPLERSAGYWRSTRIPGIGTLVNLDDASQPTEIVTREDFARQLTTIRELAGLTVREVARAVDMPASTIGGFLSGRHLPPLRDQVLDRVLQVCGVRDPAVLAQWREAAIRLRRLSRKVGTSAPYLGLAAFEVEHADRFFGRAALTTRLIDRLTTAQRSGLGMVALVGASGSGKSSVLRAGVMAALQRDAAGSGSAAWSVLLLTPGRRPLDELANCLAGQTGQATAPIEALLRADPAQSSWIAHPAALAADHAGTQLDRRLVLVVDQFEEVFTLCEDPAERNAFIAALTAIAATRDASIVLGIRADFYAHAFAYPVLASVLQENLVLVTTLTTAEVQSAITGPAHVAGVGIEGALVDLLLHDMDPEAADALSEHRPAAALPLLQHALIATWEHGQGRHMSVADYMAAGGIQGAIARTAEEIFAGLTTECQQVARNLFLRLVEVADDAPDTQRHLPLAELTAGLTTLQKGEIWTVIDRFVERRLITTDFDSLWISHEALLTAWPRLREWISANRAGLLVRRRLYDAAQTWQDMSRSPDALYRGQVLIEALAWTNSDLRQGRGYVALSDLEQEFLAASVRGARRRRVVRTNKITAATAIGLFVAILIVIMLTA